MANATKLDTLLTSIELIGRIELRTKKLKKIKKKDSQT